MKDIEVKINTVQVKKEISKLKSSMQELEVPNIKIENKQIDSSMYSTNKEETGKSKQEGVFSNMSSMLSKIQPQLDGMSSIAEKVNNKFKQMGSIITSGVGHILKYTGALFSVKDIYGTLGDAVQSWLSSQNSGALQLNASMENLKNNIRRRI